MTELERIATSLENIDKNFQYLINTMIPTEEDILNQKACQKAEYKNKLKLEELNNRELKVREESITLQEKEMEAEKIRIENL